MGVFDFWKKPLFIYNFDFNYFIVYWSFDSIRIMLLCISSSLIAEWLCYWTCNPETWVRFPEGMTSFDFTWNKNYTDTRSARGKMPFLFFSMILHFCPIYRLNILRRPHIRTKLSLLLFIFWEKILSVATWNELIRAVAHRSAVMEPMWISGK